MMNHRFNLFYAGYTAYVPTLYYNQMSLAQTYQQEEDEGIKSYFSKLCDSLKDYEEEYNSYLKSAMGVAQHFELEILPAPGTHHDYFTWLNNYTEVFERQFPMSRIDHYYFLYSRKIAEICSHLGLMKCYIDVTLELNNKLDLRHRIEKSLKDIEYIIFKMMASAALLSSEPRQNYFNVFYKSMSLGFQPFKDLDLTGIQTEELKSLREDIDKYHNSVTDGFKQCVGLLKDLQV